MATRKMVPSSVRASRTPFVLAVGLILASLAGCNHHKRTVLRPSYGTSTVIPSPATPGCATCPGGSASRGGAVTSEPDSAEPYLTPAAAAPSAAGPDGVSRTGGSPPVPNAADEPPLNAPASAPTTRGSGNGPELTRPSAFRSTGRRASAPRASARLSLRNEVSPYLASPDDLFQPPKADRPWKYVVVHHSANATGGYDQIDRDHRKILGFEGCGYHFVIGNGTDSPDGQIEVAERWLNQRQGVHCRNGKTPDVNEYGIGICLVGNFDQAAPTEKQVAAARALVAYLGDRYRVAADRIGTHEEFANGPTACPGKNFPAEAIFGSKHLAIR